MIKKSQVKMKLVENGIYLSAETNQCKYGQHYYFKVPLKDITSIEETRLIFIEFYNKFEKGR